MVDKLSRRRRRVTILLVGGLAAIAATGFLLIFGYISSEQSTRRTFEAAEASRAHVRAALAVLENVSNAETGQRGYAVLGDPSYHTMFDNGVRESRLALAWLETRVGDDPELKPPLQLVSQAVNARLEYCGRVVAARAAHGREAATALLLGPRTPIVATAVRTTIFDFIDTAEARALSLATEAREERRASDRMALALAALALVACALTGWSVLQERRSWRAAQQVLADTNAALEIAKADAVASDTAKTRFLATASHDLRQPLHALSLYISALQRRVDTPDARKILVNMERATQSMTAMFASLLDLARIQSGVTTPDLEDVSAQDILTHVAAEFAGARLELTPTALAVRTDPRMLESLLRNFVSNALKHGGGWARLEAARVHDGVALRVIDRGPGVPPEKVDQIFVEFTRLDTKKEGLGLGLAIVKRLADILNARIEVRPAPGGGSIFEVIAPEAASASIVGVRDAAAPPDILKGVPLILIDDDPLALAAAAQALRDYGAEVRTGGSVAALEKFVDDGVHAAVLVMDLRLDEEFRGVEAADAARARMRPTPAAIIVTGDTAPDTLAMLHASGYTWLVKPVNRTELVVMVALAAAMAAQQTAPPAAPTPQTSPA